MSEKSMVLVLDMERKCLALGENCTLTNSRALHNVECHFGKYALTLSQLSVKMSLRESETSPMTTAWRFGHIG